MLDGLAIPGRNSDGAVVFARGQFSLNEHVCAFHEPIGRLCEALAERDDVVPLTLLLSGVILVPPGLLSCD